MERKTMMKFKFRGYDIDLDKPAFLVGNGINRADGCTVSWEQLMIEILPEEIQKHFSKKSGDENLFFKFNSASTSVQIAVDIPGKQKNDELTYPEIAELALSKRSPEEYDEDSKPKFLEIVRETIQRGIEEGTPSNFNHENLSVFAQENNIPILTTNFDRNFLKTPCFKGQNLDSINLYWVKQPTKVARDYQTMKNACFTPKKSINNIHSEFAIWPIHGVIGKTTCPLCLTNWDYGNYCAKIKEISKTKDWDDQQNDSTWIDILLDNDLIIMGLGLNSSETDLRALLVEREIRQKINAKIEKSKKPHKKAHTIYIYRKEAESEDMPDSKRLFFESLGVICVPMEQNKIYEVEKYLK